MHQRVLLSRLDRCCHAFRPSKTISDVSFGGLSRSILYACSLAPERSQTSIPIHFKSPGVCAIALTE